MYVVCVCSEYARDLKVRLETGNDESEGGRELDPRYPR